MSTFKCNETLPTWIYTLSLHDALPIWRRAARRREAVALPGEGIRLAVIDGQLHAARDVHADDVRNASLESARSEEHTSELQSPDHLVCRLLLEKKKNKSKNSLTLLADK